MATYSTDAAGMAQSPPDFGVNTFVNVVPRNPVAAAVGVLGLFLHASIGVSILVNVFGKMSPLKFWKSVEDPAIVAFSTSSGMATVGIPPEGIAITLGVDLILDMCRTTLNVCGDLSASVYVDRVDREHERAARLAAQAA